MQFITLLTPKQGSTLKERIARRLEWKYPDGVKLLGEYWLAGDHPNVVIITEGDDATKILDALAAWDDVFEAEVIPAVPVEQGMAHARDLMAAAAA